MTRIFRSVPPYLFALFVTIAALLLQFLVSRYVDSTPFLVFYGAVTLSAWRGGWGPGLLSTGLSAAMASYFFLASSEPWRLDLHAVFSLALFGSVSTVITWLNVRERASRNDAERQRQHLHQHLMQLPAIIMIHRGPDHRVEFHNQATARLLGNRALSGRMLRAAIPELKGQGFFELLDHVFRTGEPFEVLEAPLQIANEEGLRAGHFDLVLQPLSGSGGKVDGVMVFGIEVTEQVLARRRTEALAAEFEAVFQSIPDAVYVGNSEGIRRVNHAAFDMLGFTHAEDVQKDAATLWAEIDTRRVGSGKPIPPDEQAFTYALNGQPWVQDVLIRHPKTGEERVMRSACAPVRIGDQVVGAVAINTDVTERRRAEAERVRLCQEAEEAVRLRDEFLSIASHELKTPLTPMSLKLQSLARGLESEDASPLATRLAKDVAVMRRQVKRLSDLVNELLDVSRITTGQMKLQVEELDLSALVREVASRLEPEAERAGCSLRFEAGTPVVGLWDALRLEQVLSNLISNAIKYGPGKPIQLSVGRNGNRARLSVRDGGIGIAQEAQHRIFQRFERAVSERHYGGLGLGLYVTQQIVQAMGGTVTVESQPGLGATFHVELPLASSEVQVETSSDERSLEALRTPLAEGTASGLAARFA